jgi:hypothetical protein
MTMKPIRIVAFLAVVLPCLTSARAEEATTAADRRAQIVASSQLGESFRSNNRERYQVVVGLRAVPRGEASSDARMAGLRMAPSDLVEEKGPFLIVQRPPSTGTPAARVREAGAVGMIDGAEARPVVVNTRTGQFGLMTGIVVVKLGNPGDAAALAEANGLQLTYVADAIRYAYFRVPAGRDVVAAAKALRSAAGVESASPEVIETFRVTR